MIKPEYEKLLKNVEKPGRYIGGEFGEVIKDKEKIKLRFAFCFPDLYEIGMSNLGMKVLTSCLNLDDETWCERCYAVKPDMEEQMRKNGLPLCAIESGDELKSFDIVAFTLQYELSYTNVLNMLDLAGIPMFAKDRGNEYPIIIGGGPCAYNAEPLAPFFDLFSIGEGENALREVAELKKKIKDKDEFLKAASQLDGIYVPSLYDVTYKQDGAINSIEPKYDWVPKKVTKTVIDDLDNVNFPTSPEVPFIEAVHDRVTLEVFRGCIRGCRFCQAGMIYRPYREKSADTLNCQAIESIKNTGYSEISLCSLSISDYNQLNELFEKLLSWTEDKKINLSLPSMRIDNFGKELLDKAMNVRQSGLTFAPEAGTQRLRDVINKNITEDEILSACNIAFDGGRSSMKLYFMNGLPTETDEDIEGIAILAQKIVDLFYSVKRKKTKPLSVSVSVSCFVPKPFTPFQWEAQDTMEELQRKQQLLKNAIHSNKINYKYHDARVSFLEAVFARGDRRLATVIAEAVKRGCKFDGWDEHFNFDLWMKTFEDLGVDPSFYANRKFGYDEILPWDHIDCGVSKKFLINEAKKAHNEETTLDCRSKCSGCGVKNCKIHAADGE